MATFLAIPSAADISRDSYDKTKSYSRVLYQQAKPLIDMELNEAQDINDDKVQTLFKLFGTVFVQTAAEITANTTTGFYINGGEVICEGNQSYLAGITYASQSLSAVHVSQLVWDVTTNIVPVLTTLIVGTRDDLAVLCLVKTEVNSTADPSLKDPTLGSETAIRWKIESGIRVLEGYGGAVENCDASFTYYNPNGCWRVPLAWIHRTTTLTLATTMIEDIRSHQWNSEDEIFVQFDGGDLRIPDTLTASTIICSVGSTVHATMNTVQIAIPNLVVHTLATIESAKINVAVVTNATINLVTIDSAIINNAVITLSTVNSLVNTNATVTLATIINVVSTMVTVTGAKITTATIDSAVVNNAQVTLGTIVTIKNNFSTIGSMTVSTIATIADLRVAAFTSSAAITVTAGNIVASAGEFIDRTGGSVVPVGTIIAMASSVVPTGFIACNGAPADKTTYADLFTSIGHTWRADPGSNQFYLPDLRGTFLRGTGTHGTLKMADTTTAFAGPAVGASANDKMQGHWHKLASRETTPQSIGPNTSDSSVFEPTSDTPNWKGVSGAYDLVSDGTNGVPRTGKETIPVNYGVNYIIKF